VQHQVVQKVQEVDNLVQCLTDVSAGIQQSVIMPQPDRPYRVEALSDAFV